MDQCKNNNLMLDVFSSVIKKTVHLFITKLICKLRHVGIVKDIKCYTVYNNNYYLIIKKINKQKLILLLLFMNCLLCI